MVDVSPDQVLARACVRHGGAATERRLEQPLTLTVEKLDGPLLRFKGLGLKFAAPTSATLIPAQKRVVFHNYPDAGQDTVYDAGTVTVGSDGKRIERYRQRFRGLKKHRLWSPSDVVYFFGYALTNYLSHPFSLRGLEVVRHRSTPKGDELWFRFPPDADTHSHLQGFYFDRSGLLVRHDYRAEVLGTLFNGAHFLDAYRDIDGLLIATDRRVRAKAWHYPFRSHVGLRVLHGILRAPAAALPPTD